MSQRLATAPRSVFRVVVSAVGRSLNLETSRCKRTLQADGAVLEFVELDGDCHEITDGELDQFVERFPLERLAHRGS